MHKEIHWDKDLKIEIEFINYFLYKITVKIPSSALLPAIYSFKWNCVKKN